MKNERKQKNKCKQLESKGQHKSCSPTIEVILPRVNISFLGDIGSSIYLPLSSSAKSDAANKNSNLVILM